MRSPKPSKQRRRWSGPTLKLWVYAFSASSPAVVQVSRRGWILSRHNCDSGSQSYSETETGRVQTGSVKSGPQAQAGVAKSRRRAGARLTLSMLILTIFG
jgi:hypothetical protein